LHCLPVEPFWAWLTRRGALKALLGALCTGWRCFDVTLAAVVAYSLSDARSRGSGVVLRLKRIHDTGSESLITQHQDGWRIQINLREPNHVPGAITGYLTPDVESAKKLADKETLRGGHVCNGSCQGWTTYADGEVWGT
jgi:hypothetical protein